MGTTTGYEYNKYEKLAAGLFNGMQRRSKRRDHPLDMKALDFVLWAMRQAGFVDNCDKWFEAGKPAYSKLKPSCNRLDDDEPYSFENIEMITWGDHLKHTASSRYYGTGKNSSNHRAVEVIDSLGNVVHTAKGPTYALRFANPKTNNNGSSSKISNICNGVGSSKTLYGYTYRWLI